MSRSGGTMQGSRAFTAAVIGCGRIAGGIGDADDAPTHADAYDRHPAFRMTACVEPDRERRLAFLRRWDVPRGYADLDACLAAENEFDVASVCTPTPAHAAILWKLLETPVHAVLCEKPLTDDAAESARLVDAYDGANKALAVAHLRRWAPAMAALKKEFEDGVWGRVRTVTGSYTKGALNNGSHLIDLVHYLFGRLTLRMVTGKRIDGDARDPTVDAVLGLESGAPVHLTGADARDYALFELHVVAEGGVVDVERSGHVIRRRRPVPDPYYSDYKLLDQGEWQDIGHGDPFLNALANLQENLSEGKALLSDGRSALAAQRLCETMIEKSRDPGVEWIEA